MTPTATVKQVVLASFLEGRWIETVYSLDDPRWREAIKILRDIGAKVKLMYKQ